MFNANYNGNFGTSEAMKGKEDEFRADLSKDYNNRSFPFGENATRTGNIGLQLAYKLNDSRLNMFLAANYYMFSIGWNTPFDDYAMMNIISITPGVEYSLGDRSSLWNIFGRAGINLNFIAGKVRYLFFTTNVAPTFRIGGECEFGGRLNIPSTRISLELSAAYTNVNLIGKNYERFDVKPPDELYERELNDGRNPDNPGDVNRKISFLILKGGIRLWF